MSVNICPRCQQRFISDENEIDIIHECGNQGGASEVLKNEDVVRVGNWEDFTGSGIINNVNMQGITNNIWGSRGAIEGEKVSTLTSRGNDNEIFRTRKHLEFINLKGGKDAY